MLFLDSTDKIFDIYISSLVKGTQEIDGYKMEEKKIYVSPFLMREIKCNACGGCCCHPYSMDFIPTEPRPENCTERIVKGKPIWTLEHTGDKSLSRCYYNDVKTGYCLVHKTRAMSCDFEHIRFKMYKKDDKVLIGTFPYGRGWAMIRGDGTKGAKCTLCTGAPFNPAYKEDVIRKMYRLKEWIDYYGIDTYINELIDYAKSMDGTEKRPYYLNDKSKHAGNIF